MGDIMLTKFKTEILIIVDIDDANSVNLIYYSKQEGLIKYSLFSESEEAKLDNFYVSYDVQNVLTASVINKINNAINLQENLTVSWVFTGEITRYSKNNLSELVTKFFSSLKKIGSINKVIIDKYNLINYLTIFPNNLLVLNMEGLLNKLPLTIINNKFFGLKNGVNLTYLDSEKEFRFTPKIQNIYFQDNSSVLKIANIDIPKGYLWFWRKDDTYYTYDLRLKLSQKYDLVYLDKTFSEKKDSNWSVVLSKLLIKKILAKKKLEPSDYLVKAKKEYYINVGKLESKDLLVINGQRVEKGEPLNKNISLNMIMESLVYLSPGKGVINTKHLKQGFISVISSDVHKKDIHWLDNIDKEVISANSFDLTFKLKVNSIPLYSAIGNNSEGILICAENYEVAERYASELPNLIIVCNLNLSVEKLLNLYMLGVKAVILPCFKSIDMIPNSYWDFFSLGVFMKDANRIQPTLWHYLLLHQHNPCYFDTTNYELKLPYDFNKESKFNLMALSSEKRTTLNIVREIKKGSKVLLTNSRGAFQECEVKYRDHNRLTLYNLMSGELLSESIDNVTLI